MIPFDAQGGSNVQRPLTSRIKDLYLNVYHSCLYTELYYYQNTIKVFKQHDWSHCLGTSHKAVGLNLIILKLSHDFRCSQFTKSLPSAKVKEYCSHLIKNVPLGHNAMGRVLI